MAGLKVVPVKSLLDGSLDLEDLKAKAVKHKDNLAAFMVCEHLAMKLERTNRRSTRSPIHRRLVCSKMAYRKYVVHHFDHNYVSLRITTQACKIIHENGGQVYLDGANLNAQIGVTNPATCGGDVCHMNLHKTFAM
jgi:glycine dehydrogenase